MADHRFAAVFLLLALATLLPESSQAQPPLTQAKFDIRYADISTELPQKSILALHQSSLGELWIGTQEGLHLYTGTRRKQFSYDFADPTTIGSNYITSIAETAEGQILVGTRDAGVNLYDRSTDSFRSPLPPEIQFPPERSTEQVFAIFVDSNGRAWIGHENAITRIDTDTRLQPILGSELDDTNVGSVLGFAESEGYIFAITSRAGILTISKDGVILNRISIDQMFGDTSAPVQTTGIKVDEDGFLWVWSLEAGIAVIDPREGNTVDRVLDENTLNRNFKRVYDVIQIDEKTFWIGTQAGLMTYNTESSRLEQVASDIELNASPDVTKLIRTTDQAIWIGTPYGLYSATPTIFTTISTLNSSISNDSINAFAEDDAGNIWVGTDDGLNKINPKGDVEAIFNELTEPALTQSKIMSLLADDSGIWVGTLSGGLNYLSNSEESIRQYTHDNEDPTTLASMGVTSILKTNTGELLVATYSGGLSVYNGQTDSFIRIPPRTDDTKKRVSKNIIALYQDSMGAVYAGTDGGGLALFDPSSRAFTDVIRSEKGNSRSLSNDIVWSFYEDEDGDLWIGTASGGANLWRQADRRQSIPVFEHYSENVGLGSRAVSSISQDVDGYIWFSHNQGLTRISKDLSHVRHFGERSGLVGTDFNVGASFKSSEGKIFFGGNRGFNVIDPNELPGSGTPPHVAISEVRVMNKRVGIDTNAASIRMPSLKLTHKDILLEVEFFSDSLAKSKQVSYAYLMEGLTTEWVQGPDKHTAAFTTLPTGTYTLRMAASGPSGEWNWNGASLRIEVLPPPWLSPWAYALYVALTAVALIYIWRQQQQKAYRQLQARVELEDKVRERTEELEIATAAAEAANKAKSQFLATMSHEIRTPLHGIVGMADLLLLTELTSSQRRFANSAKRSGQSLLSIINDILDYSKLEASKVEIEKTTFDINHEIDEILALQAPLAHKKGLQLISIAAPPAQSFIVADQTKIGQCLTNLVGNAIKFTNNGKIIVQCSVSETAATDANDATLELLVRDQGIGMDESTQKRVFDHFTQADASTTRKFGGTGLGLSITKQFVELMGGKITIKSEPSIGTEIAISVPIRTPHKHHRNDLGHKKELDRSLIGIYSDDADVRVSLISQLRRLDAETVILKDILNPSEDLFRCNKLVVPIQERKQASILLSKHSLDTQLICFHEGTTHDEQTDTFRLPVSLEELTEVFFHSSQEKDFALRSATEQGLSIDIFRGKALVAEDIQVNQEIIVEVLRTLGLDATVVENGEAAFEAFKQEAFDIVFMDCQMPVLDGYEATAFIRQLERDTGKSPTPIIALTAGAGAEEKNLCRKSGMDLFVGKPFTLDDIRRAVQDCAPHLATNHAQANHRNSVLAAEHSATSDQPATESGLNANIAEKYIGTKSNSAIDDEVIAQLLSLDTQNSGLLQKLIEGYRQQLLDSIKQLQLTLESGDVDAVRRMGHAIKSMSANMGAPMIRERFFKVESDAKRGLICLTQEDLDQTKEDFAIYRDAAIRFMQQRS